MPTTPKGLVFHEENTKTITEVFGMSNGKYLDLCEAFRDHFLKNILDLKNKMEEAAKNGRKNQFMEELKANPQNTSHTQTLKTFLESEEFKKVGMELKTPNDFFLLGYMFHTSIEALEDAAEKAAKMAEKVSGMGDIPEPIRRIMEDLLKD